MLAVRTISIYIILSILWSTDNAAASTLKTSMEWILTSIYKSMGATKSLFGISYTVLMWIRLAHSIMKITIFVISAALACLK